MEKSLQSVDKSPKLLIYYCLYVDNLSHGDLFISPWGCVHVPVGIELKARGDSCVCLWKKKKPGQSSVPALVPACLFILYVVFYSEPSVFLRLQVIVPVFRRGHSCLFLEYAAEVALVVEANGYGNFGYRHVAFLNKLGSAFNA